MVAQKNTLEELLSRYADKIYPSRESLLAAAKKRKLTIYHGVDPTAPQLHLGHSTNYLLLSGLQDLGHKIILLIGDFTAQIGDPTGKSQTRKPLTPQEVRENSETYRKQAGKILNFTAKRNPVVVKRNSTWLSKLTFVDVVRVAAKTTVNQMIQRDMFQERMKAGREIYLHEFLYPLMQGYDSVAMGVDAEVGGTDQTFNMLVGRGLLKALKQKEKFVITTPLLVNPKTGKKLMSKSEGGYVALSDSPQEMYGKVMALPDEVIFPCLRLCTRVPLKEISRIETSTQQKKLSLRDAKAFLAKEIIIMYHGEGKAAAAEKEFERIFQRKEAPRRVAEFVIKSPTRRDIVYVLVGAQLAPSKSQAWRLIKQKGVKFGGRVIKSPFFMIESDGIVQVGKRHFVRVVYR